LRGAGLDHVKSVERIGNEKAFPCFRRRKRLRRSKSRRTGGRVLRYMLIVMDARIKKALKIVEREFAKSLRVKDVAPRVRLSGSRFGRLFKKETRRTFKPFVLAFRMKRAKSLLLLDRTLRTKDVAMSIGYTYAHLCVFTRDFEKYCGCSPSECRRAAA
jgi:YesN/AraC family two-component response regulator